MSNRISVKPKQIVQTKTFPIVQTNQHRPSLTPNIVQHYIVATIATGIVVTILQAPRSAHPILNMNQHAIVLTIAVGNALTTSQVLETNNAKKTNENGDYTVLQ